MYYKFSTNTYSWFYRGFRVFFEFSKSAHVFLIHWTKLSHVQEIIDHVPALGERLDYYSHRQVHTSNFHTRQQQMVQENINRWHETLWAVLCETVIEIDWCNLFDEITTFHILFFLLNDEMKINHAKLITTLFCVIFNRIWTI